MSSSDESGGDVCPICRKEFDKDSEKDISTLFEKGAKSINEASRERGQGKVVAGVGQRVHKLCRRNWTNPNDIKKALRKCQGTGSSIKKRSA